MATTFYLSTSTLSTNIYGLETAAGPLASATKVVSTADSGTEIQWTVSAGGAAVSWCSDPVTANVTITNAVTFSIQALESHMSANAGARARLYRVSNDFATWTEMGGGPFDDGAEFDTATQQMSWTGTPTTNNALVIGQRVGVRFYITNIGTMGGGYTCTLYHGSSYTNS